MTCKDVTSQAELDAALVDEDVSCVHVKSERGVWLTLRENKGKRARLSGNATAELFDNATAELSGNATARLSGNATAELFDNATARAAGSSTVHLRQSSKVTASVHVAVHLHSARATVEGGVVIDLTQLDFDDVQTWCVHHGVDVVDGRVVLFKALPEDLTSGRDYGQPTTYVVGAELVAADWVANHECGGGLHLSPTPHQAARYQSDAKRFLRCSAALEDVYPIEGGSSDAPKAKVRALRVEAEVDAFARELATT